MYLSVIDREGNIASWIQSNSDIFGSGVVVDGMGFPLQDRMGGFSFDPQHPNALAPHKRPYHTIIPGFMEKGDQHIGFGIMRGMNQAQAQAQFVSNVVDHHMNIQAALEAPRFTKLTHRRVRRAHRIESAGRDSRRTDQARARTERRRRILGIHGRRPGRDARQQHRRAFGRLVAAQGRRGDS